jgi:hypothetical protein
MEVRYDHRSILSEGVVAWIPIVYSILMIVASVLGLFFWSRGGRQVLLAGYLLAILVGLTGFWFHTDGRFLRSVRRELAAWVRKVPDEDKPPALAPLAFAGFGILGALACTKRFQPSTS